MVLFFEKNKIQHSDMYFSIFIYTSILFLKPLHCCKKFSLKVKHLINSIVVEWFDHRIIFATKWPHTYVSNYKRQKIQSLTDGKTKITVHSIKQMEEFNQHLLKACIFSSGEGVGVLVVTRVVFRFRCCLGGIWGIFPNGLMTLYLRLLRLSGD